ncbi:MAG: choice-of-anchor Q domain-containing protein [Cyanobacteria bacterium P01_G01_bin.54]
MGDPTGATLGPDLNNLISVDPLLMPLGNYGGTTQTHALQVGSPALNTGDNAFVTTVTAQRGEARIVDGMVDIGATEGAFIPPTTAAPESIMLDMAEIQRSFIYVLEETEELVEAAGRGSLPNRSQGQYWTRAISVTRRGVGN